MTRLSDEATRRATRLRHVNAADLDRIDRDTRVVERAILLYEAAADLLSKAEQAEEASRR